MIFSWTSIQKCLNHKKIEYRCEKKELIISVDLDIEEFEIYMKYLWLIKDIYRLTMKNWNENNPTLVNLFMRYMRNLKIFSS